MFAGWPAAPWFPPYAYPVWAFCWATTVRVLLGPVLASSYIRCMRIHRRTHKQVIRQILMMAKTMTNTILQPWQREINSAHKIIAQTLGSVSEIRILSRKRRFRIDFQPVPCIFSFCRVNAEKYDFNQMVEGDSTWGAREMGSGAGTGKQRCQHLRFWLFLVNDSAYRTSFDGKQ